ncbi:response regulator [Paenibacillus sp. FSL H7-0331]|uniref:response regulator transcription factor n=1 Tax=Paenibacillus sp. FSL H7-0331 TaxID=1920421 RepID=UPI000970146E|nr:response regulator [Paenibacillus sp. FSL H7-0331]OMF15798.1 hypothetical protein BK127_15880 [Paenibacillus sp. FSL H7-0331]
MRIVIADDESLVRISLTSMIVEMEGAWELAGEATNGAELLELIRREKPDIVLVDIRMPLLNGLQAMEKGSIISPNTYWIIVSGYSDFSYVQEALKRGAVDYLLKPVSPQDLEEALIKSSQEKQKRQLLLGKRFENELVSLVHGLTDVHMLPDDSMIPHVRFQIVMIYNDGSHCDVGKMVGRSPYLDKLRCSMDAYSASGVYGVFILMPMGGAAFITAWNQADHCRSNTLVQQLLTNLKEAVHQDGNNRIAITAIFSEECENCNVLLERLDELQAWGPLRAVNGINCCSSAAELAKLSSKEGVEELAAILLRLNQCYKEKDYMTYAKTVIDLERWSHKHEESCLSTLKSAICDFIHVGLDCKLDHTQTFSHWKDGLSRHGEQLLSSGEGIGCSLVDMSIAYIEQKYMQDISITQVAQELNVTPNYLSTLFRKKTGTTFIKYVTHIRMLKSKELLALPNAQVQKVSEQMGYLSTRHFTKLFKEHTGCYPSDYRKQLLQQETQTKEQIKSY